MHSEVGIDPQLFSYEFLNEIMDNPCSDGGLRSDRIGCTKFNEGCTKGSKVHRIGCTQFCEGCTKASKVCSKVRISPQTLPYGFQNEIMDHSCLNGGLGSDRIGCTKFNEGCTKGSQVRSKAGIDPQSISYGFLN